jgi:hypothetical protein
MHLAILSMTIKIPPSSPPELASGIGKALSAKALIKFIESRGERCLICDATGIAAVQYPGGTTLYSLFRLGIAEQLCVAVIRDVEIALSFFCFGLQPMILFLSIVNESLPRTDS